jgi:hypothetical protein
MKLGSLLQSARVKQTKQRTSARSRLEARCVRPMKKSAPMKYRIVASSWGARRASGLFGK